MASLSKKKKLRVINTPRLLKSTRIHRTHFDDLPLHAVYEYLEPLELLACMYLNKNSRRSAAKALQRIDEQTEMKREMFSEWLKDPLRHPEHNCFYKKMSVSNKFGSSTGPLRFDAIKNIRNLDQNFVILSYMRSYILEKSVVAIFDQGKLLAIYRLYSEQFYEKSEYRHDTCSIILENSGLIDDVTNNPWSIKLVKKWEEGFLDFVAHANYKLFHLFKGTLSPIEISHILFHALSSDSRVVFSCKTAVFDNFTYDFHWEDFDELGYLCSKWKEELELLENSTISL